MRLSFRNIIVLGSAVYSTMAPLLVNAQQVGTCTRSLAEAFLDTNNVRARMVQTGGFFYRGEPHVYEVPKGSGIHAAYSGNLWIGGMIDGKLHASAARYSNNELWAGPLDDQGLPPIDCTEFERIYKISKSDVELYEQSGIASPDLLEWPTGLGSPTVDRHGVPIDLHDLPFAARKSRVIDLTIGERPAIQGDQSLWWIMNDRGNVHNTTLTPPLGIEVHAMAFAATGGSVHVSNATIYNFRIKNRNELDISEAFMGASFDIDLGYSGDDRMGSDSLRSMAYVFNSDDDDEDHVNLGAIGYGPAPPAVGVILLGGASAELDQADNDFDGTIDEEGERMRATVIAPIWGGGGVTGEPTSGAQFYSYMQGKWKDGIPFTLGGFGRNTTSIPVKFIFPGDPVQDEFWSEHNIDGLGNTASPGHRRLLLASGPFSLKSMQDFEFTLAVVWARGKNHLDSVLQLRNAADNVTDAYELGGYDYSPPRRSDEIPARPEPASAIANNFPEPFSDRTTIRYRVSDRAPVHLAVNNGLGQEVATLVNETKDAGEYSTVFDGTNLPSGVYFYRIQIGHATATRSMMLVK